jgi:hypothetical protein
MDRWEQKNKVIKAFDTLIQEIEIYFNIWKKQGGGTTGHLIGSMIAKLKSSREMWKNKA